MRAHLLEERDVLCNELDDLNYKIILHERMKVVKRMKITLDDILDPKDQPEFINGITVLIGWLKAQRKQKIPLKKYVTWNSWVLNTRQLLSGKIKLSGFTIDDVKAAAKLK